MHGYASQEYRDSDFEGHAGDPRTWLILGQQLLDSAQILLQKAAQRKGRPSKKFKGPTNSDGIAVYLSGLAVENLVKGILVAQANRVHNAQLDPWPGSSHGHDLRELFKAAGISLSEKEKSAMKTMQTSVLWGEKYPIPKSAQVMEGYFLQDYDGLMQDKAVACEVATSLFKRLTRTLYEKYEMMRLDIKSGKREWDGP